MKKSLLFIIAFSFIILKTIAQPVVTAANLTPQIGESDIYQQASAINVDDKSGGLNQTWDYSILQDSGLTYYLVVVTPSSTPYADSFPGSNLAVKTANDTAFAYYNSQTSRLDVLGDAAAIGKIFYTTPQISIAYPFAYNSFFTDSVVRTTSPVNITARGKDSLTGDGYGTLKVPGRIYSNVLRVKYIENITASFDTTIVQGGVSFSATYVINTRTINYLYFTPDTHSYLLSVATTQTNSTILLAGLPFFQNTNFIKSVTYLKSFMLPVSFTSFTASLNNRSVDLNWQTAQEINTNKFNVQRSLTGNDFSDINEIAATGNSSGSHYQYTDNEFAKSDVPPTVYYRIKEVDKDGKMFYSTTAIIHGNTNMVRLYPNPAKDYINFNIKDATVADAVSIYDAKGHLVQQYQNYQINKPINVSNLDKGTYFIQVKIKDKATTTTVVKE